MLISNRTKQSKVAARIINEAGRINRDLHVTISELAPASIKFDRTIPRKQGWSIVDIFPINACLRKDYVKYLKETDKNEIWIRLATKGGQSKIYVK